MGLIENEDSLMREQYQKQLQQLKEEIALMGQMCEEALMGALKALHDQDPGLAKQVAQSDYLVDQKEREIEHLCLNLIMQQQPLASDLRFVSSALKLITDLERVGDQACDIAEIVHHLDFSEAKYFSLVERMAVVARGMVEDSIEAFVKQNSELATEVIKRDDEVDNYLGEEIEQLVSLIVENSHDAHTIIDLIMIAKYLERIGDHAVNIAQWAIFQQTGIHVSNHPEAGDSMAS